MVTCSEVSSMWCACGGWGGQDGSTPLMCAVVGQRERVAELVLQAGANINLGTLVRALVGLLAWVFAVVALLVSRDPGCCAVHACTASVRAAWS